MNKYLVVAIEDGITYYNLCFSEKYAKKYLNLYKKSILCSKAEIVEIKEANVIEKYVRYENKQSTDTRQNNRRNLHDMQERNEGVKKLVSELRLFAG